MKRRERLMMHEGMHRAVPFGDLVTNPNDKFNTNVNMSIVPVFVCVWVPVPRVGLERVGSDRARRSNLQNTEGYEPLSPTGAVFSPQMLGQGWAMSHK